MAAAGVAQALRHYDTAALDESIVSTNIMAEMAGDLMVREGERGGPKMIALADGDGGTGDGRHFVSLPWEDAVEEFRKRGNVTPYDLQRLIQDVSVRSVAERNKLLAFVQETTLDKLATAVSEGETYADFAEALRNDLVPIGVTEAHDHYLQCLPAETLVSGAVIRAAHRRWYQGPMVEVVTASGRKFSATPNHPMLTRAGWRGAGDLREGDDLVGYRGEQSAVVLRDDDVTAPPASIAQLFHACTQVGSLERARSSKHDFHGDGRDGNVDVARPAGNLGFGVFAAIKKPLEQHVFAEAAASATRFCEACGNLAIVTKRCGLCDAPVRDAGSLQPPANHIVAGAEVVRELVRADAGLVSPHKVGDRQVPARGLASGLSATLKEAAPSGAEGANDASLADEGGNSAGRDAKVLGHAADAQPGDVEFDRVVSVRGFDFDGHVFNLTTKHGYFAIDGLYTGNTVFRTNVQGAYSAGRDRASKDPEILAERPFALYLTAGDGFVRSEHAEYAERNKGVYRIGSAEWEAVRPPPKDSPFNCRCSWVTLTEEQARERGAEV